MPGQGHQPLSTKGFSRVLAHTGLLPTPPSCRAAGPRQLGRVSRVSFLPRGANVPLKHVKPETAPSPVRGVPAASVFLWETRTVVCTEASPVQASARGHTRPDTTNTPLPRPMVTVGDSGLLAAGAEERRGPLRG